MDKQDLLQQINQLYKQQDWQAIEVLCTKGLEYFPNSASTYYNRAIAKAKMGKLEEAKIDLEKALEIRPDQNTKQFLAQVQQKLENAGSQTPQELNPSLLFEQCRDDLKAIFSEQEKTPEKFHHYEVIEELGRGGMGKVYKAFDPKMKRRVAIKVILYMGDKEKERFISEAQIMAKMQHPDIVTVYQVDIKPQSGHLYIVMDFIEGQTLAGQNFTPREALKVISLVAKAIDYAHSKGVIHRDLKPANIMLRKDNKPIVMDFGLAKESSKDITGSGEILGTPRYMAPEQALGKNKEICAATDVYALGVCFYELLTGEAAIKGQSPAEVIYHILHSPIPPLQKHKPLLAKELSIICAKAMAKEHFNRYQKAKDFVEDIERFLQGEIIKAQPFPLWYHLRHKIKRNKLTFAMFFVGILLLVIAFIYNNYKRNQKVAKYIAQSQQILKQVPQKLREDLPAKKLPPLIVAIDINNILEKYLKAIEPLNKALIDSNNTSIHKELLRLYRNLGLLALAKKEYLLSSRAFKQCLNLDQKIGKKLQALWKEQREKQLIRLKEIMLSLEKKQPLLQQLDWWEIEISRMKGVKIVKKLLPFIKSKNKWQRKLAIKALGKLGNTFTKKNDKDSIEWLLEYLSKLKPLKDNEINEQNKHQNKQIEEIIEALGWLKDSRSKDLVYKKRWLAGQHSLLWDRTEISYKRILIPKKEMNNAQDFLKRAIMKSEKGDLDGAINDYNQAISLNPKYANAYNNRGILWKEKEEFEKAINDFNQVIFLNPKDKNVYINRGTVWEKKGELEKAINDFNQAISLNPKNTNAYINRGTAWEKKGKLEKAINDFNQVIFLNPKNTNAYINRGNFWNKKGELEKAINDYNQAISLDPKSALAYNNRGIFWKNKRELEKAINDFNQAIFLDPKNAKAYNNRGNIWKNKGELEKAINDFNQAIFLDPKNAPAYFNRGLLWEKKREVEKAIHDYNQAISLNPKYIDAYISRGNIWNKKGELEKAINDYNQVISFNPKNAPAYINRGAVWEKKGELEKAISDYNQVISFNPKNIDVYNNRGNIWTKKGELEKAINDYNQAISLNRNLMARL